jgi:putative peptidoglycan lipid II flippase
MKRLGAAALLMTSAVMLSRVVGYLRDALIAARFGANGGTDAFYAAFTIPDWLNYLVAGGTLSITFLPLYARHLAEDDEPGANRLLSIVTTVMVTVVAALVVLGEILARPLSTWFFAGLSAAALDDCVRYTRILLPAQIFFIAGGLANATLFARGRFAAAALAPVVYNLGTILGGLLLGGALGAEGLVWGTLAGAAAGPFLFPAVDAWRRGARWRADFAARHPGFLEWLKLTLPLMVGVSLITADDWFIRHFAVAEPGAVTRLSYAKRLVAVPIAVAGQAVGQASMPFFARLYAEGKRDELADTIARTLRGAGIVAMLVGAWMIALAAPLMVLLFSRGKFDVAAARSAATYTAIFAAAVPLFSLQGLISRAFYAARSTLTPMIATTIVTIVSFPIYALMWRLAGAAGLAVASGAGILLQTLVIAALAPRLLPELRRSMGPTFRGLAGGLALAALAGAAAWGTVRLAAAHLPASGHRRELVLCVAGTVAFAAVVALLAPRLGIQEPRLFLGKLAARLRRRTA